MANRKRLLNLSQIETEPLETADIGKASGGPTNTAPHNPPEDIWQLQVDVINVLEGRVDISSFEPTYQERIKNYYRFSGTVHMSKYPVIAKRTNDTLDLV
jgi:hypothetical protein